MNKQKLTHLYDYPRLRFYGIDYDLTTMDRATMVALYGLINSSHEKVVNDLKTIRERIPGAEIDMSALMSAKHRRELFKRMVAGLKLEISKRPLTEVSAQPGDPLSENFMKVAQHLLAKETFDMILAEAVELPPRS